MIEVVRRAERLDERLGQVDKRAAAIGQRDPAAAEDIDRLPQLLGDVVQRLVPGRPPPLAAATLASPDQRRLRPLVVRLEKQPRRALRAQAGAEHRVVRIALQPGHPTVLDRHLHRATHRTHATHAVDRPSARGSNTAHVRCRGRAHRNSSTSDIGHALPPICGPRTRSTNCRHLTPRALSPTPRICVTETQTRMRGRHPASAKKDYTARPATDSERTCPDAKARSSAASGTPRTPVRWLQTNHPLWLMQLAGAACDSPAGVDELLGLGLADSARQIVIDRNRALSGLKACRRARLATEIAEHRAHASRSADPRRLSREARHTAWPAWQRMSRQETSAEKDER